MQRLLLGVKHVNKCASTRYVQIMCICRVEDHRILSSSTLSHLDCDGPTDSLRSVFWGGLAAVVLMGCCCFACFSTTSLDLAFVGALVDFLL